MCVGCSKGDNHVTIGYTESIHGVIPVFGAVLVSLSLSL